MRDKCAMSNEQKIDVERLKADIDAFIARTAKMTPRRASNMASGDKNPDWYRDFFKRGNNKQPSVDFVTSFCRVIGKDPADYIIGQKGGAQRAKSAKSSPAEISLTATVRLPNEGLLTEMIAGMLETVGLDEIAQTHAGMLADQFPGAFRLALSRSEDPGSEKRPKPPKGDHTSSEDHPD